MSEDRAHSAKPALPHHELTPTGALVRELANLKAQLDSQRRELDELRDAQLLLEAARDDYAELHDLAPIAQLTISRGAIRSANLAAAELLEHERGSLLHRPWRSFIHWADRSQLAKQLGKPGPPQAAQARLRLRSSQQVTVHVRVRLSLRHPEVQHLSLVPIARHADRSEPAARRRILLVEDHHDTAHAISLLLEQQGYAVVAVDSLRAAIENEARVDAIISDITLPDGSGLDLLKQLRRHGEQPAIALSGLAMPADVAKKAGFDLHLTKPIDFSRLTQALGALLDHGRTSLGMGN